MSAPQNIANEDQLVRYCKALPKIELHVHLEGSLRPEVLLRLAERNHIRLPFSCPEDWRSLCNYRTFGDFAKVLLMGVYCLRRPEDFFDVAADMGAHMADQNILYSEVTWTPQFYLDRGCSLDSILAALNEARAQAKVRFGVEMRWIPDLVRSYPRPAWAITKWASHADTRRGGVVALGLGGPEAGHPASGFAAHFEHARSRGLPANPHAGEGMGPESIREALQHLHPSRLGHGVRAIEDSALVAFLASKAVPLEVCVTSNIRLGVFPSYAKHPVKRLIDAGCRVSLNSDDPVLFQTTLANEYVHAVTRCGLSIGDLQRTITDALLASYLPDDEKISMGMTLQRGFDTLDTAFPDMPR